MMGEEQAKEGQEDGRQGEVGKGGRSQEDDLTPIDELSLDL